MIYTEGYAEMKSIIKRGFILVFCILVCLLAGCGSSLENEELSNEVMKYKKYDELINYLEEGDYHAAAKIITGMSGAKDNSEANSNLDTEKEYIGTWISEKDGNCRFTLDANGVAYIGEKLCYWELLSTEYGPYGIRITVDDGAGLYEFLMEEADGEHLLKGNGRTLNMPEYLPEDASSSNFYKE